MRGEDRREEGGEGKGMGVKGKEGKGRRGEGREEHVLQGDTTLPFLIQPQSPSTITSIAFHSHK